MFTAQNVTGASTADLERRGHALLQVNTRTLDAPAVAVISDELELISDELAARRRLWAESIPEEL